MHTSSGPCALHTVCTGTPSYARALAVCTNLAGVHAPRRTQDSDERHSRRI